MTAARPSRSRREPRRRPPPPRWQPSRNAVTVTDQFDRRPRSPSGVMLASIDSPQGDHAEATAAVIAAAQPRSSTAISRVLPETGSDGRGRCPPRRAAPRAPRCSSIASLTSDASACHVVATPSPRIAPSRRARSRAIPGPRSPPTPARTSRPARASGARERSFERLLALGATGDDHRLNPGRPPSSPSVSQNRAQLVQPLVRNASRRRRAVEGELDRVAVGVMPASRARRCVLARPSAARAGAARPRPRARAGGGSRRGCAAARPRAPPAPRAARVSTDTTASITRRLLPAAAWRGP